MLFITPVPNPNNESKDTLNHMKPVVIKDKLTLNIPKGVLN